MMHAAGHRQLHGAHALFGGDRPEPQDLVPAERRHLDPGGAGFRSRQHFSQHLFRHCRRRKAGDDGVAVARQLRRCRGPGAAHVDMALAKRRIEVVDRDLEARLEQARRQMAAEIAQPDKSIAHDDVSESEC
jgi:hypothetical protein